MVVTIGRAAGTPQAEDRDAAQCPTKCRTAPHTRIVEPSVSSVEAERPRDTDDGSIWLQLAVSEMSAPAHVSGAMLARSLTRGAVLGTLLGKDKGGDVLDTVKG